ncbi:FG-GAP repeat protein [Streptomyces albidochromogenes]|uniref:FG-GAP repeat protein n=1 Tax=Streptomyces albidochromogenes TaxID=329524 RepID=UPI00142F1AAC|nr:FG-GAP repeat protein [Streptomyces albidochromogenes]
MPKAAVGGKAKAGYVNVVWGSPKGLGGKGSTSVSQDTTGVPGTAEADDLFGTAVAAADLNGDGYSDLTVTAPGERLTDTGIERQGTATVCGARPPASGAGSPRPRARQTAGSAGCLRWATTTTTATRTSP